MRVIVQPHVHLYRTHHQPNRATVHVLYLVAHVITVVRIRYVMDTIQTAHVHLRAHHVRAVPVGANAKAAHAISLVQVAHIGMAVPAPAAPLDIIVPDSAILQKHH